MNPDWPSVTAICPTYGRFERLRDSIACFLLQDYPGQRRLTISNDASTPICLTPIGNQLVIRGGIEIILTNAPKRYPTFGQKKQALADLVSTDLIAHWDDDDLALPWHLSTLINILRTRPEIECIKPVWAWPVTGESNELRIHFPRQKRYDGQMVFRRGTAVKYWEKTRKSALPLIEDYRTRGVICPLGEESRVITNIGYAFRTGDGIRHVSRSGNEERAYRAFVRGNKDFGEGDALLPADGFVHWARERLRNQFLQIVNGWKKVKIGPKARKIISKRLLQALEE